MNYLIINGLSLSFPFLISKSVFIGSSIPDFGNENHHDSVSNSVSETVCHRSDDAKLIDKLKSQIKFRHDE